MCSNPSLNLKSWSLLILSRSQTPSYWVSVLLVWSYWEVIYWETILIIFLVEDLNSSIFISYSVLPNSYAVTGIMRGVTGGLWNGAKQNVREKNLTNDLESQRGKYYRALRDASEAEDLLRANVLCQHSVSKWEGRPCSKANSDQFFKNNIILPKHVTCLSNASSNIVLYICMNNLHCHGRPGQKKGRKNKMLK